MFEGVIRFKEKVKKEVGWADLLKHIMNEEKAEEEGGKIEDVLPWIYSEYITLRVLKEAGINTLVNRIKILELYKEYEHKGLQKLNED